MKISACLLNWRRPECMKQIVQTLKSYDLFDEIIIWNNGESLNIDDVQITDCGKNIACLGRFMAIQAARNKLVYVQDDDCIPSKQSIEQLIRLMGDNKFDFANNLRLSHYNRIGCAQHLVGWGGILRKSEFGIEEIAGEYKRVFGEDELLYRQADDLFFANTKTFTSVLADVPGLQESDKNALHLEKFHVRARERMLSRLKFLTFNVDRFTDLAYQSGEDGRRDSQIGWHNYFGDLIRNSSILDVGAGLGFSRERLSRNNNKVTLQDVFPGASVDIFDDIWKIPDKSYDVVTAFDVLEHIVDDVSFLDDLKRIARKKVVITTPNRLVFNCKNRYHIREYSPNELMEICGPGRFAIGRTTDGGQIQYLDRAAFSETMEPALCGILEISS